MPALLQAEQSATVTTIKDQKSASATAAVRLAGSPPTEYVIPLCTIAGSRTRELSVKPDDDELRRQIRNEFAVGAADWDRLSQGCRQMRTSFAKLAGQLRSMRHDGHLTDSSTIQAFNQRLNDLLVRTMVMFQAELSQEGYEAVRNFMRELQKNTSSRRLGK